jgi:hypothetical protein
MLEIGLGCNCNMIYGPGASIPVWRDFFGPDLTLEMLEFDSKCAKDYIIKVNRIFIGDQANATYLRSIVAERKDFDDLIVDDGGHV